MLTVMSNNNQKARVNQSSVSGANNTRSYWPTVYRFYLMTGHFELYFKIRFELDLATFGPVKAYFGPIRHN